MTMRLATIAVVFAATVLNVAAQGQKSNLSTEVTPEKQKVRLGDPIVVSVRVTNQTAEVAETGRGATAFDCFEVTGPDGERLRYVGFDGQVAGVRVEVPPHSAATLAATLDLTDKYLFQKPGQYSIRFSGKWTGLPDSSAIELELAPGQLSEFDQVAASLLPICPEGWRLAKDAHGEVMPFGRSRVPGFALHLCLDHMRGKDVLLWFTKEEAKVDPSQQPPEKVEYLGRVRGLFVYDSVGSNTPGLWPKAVEDISRALKITKE
jgi:hypothetical protein